MFASLTMPQLIAVTAVAAVACVVALLWLWRELTSAGRRGERVELRYGYYTRIWDADDNDNPF